MVDVAAIVLAAGLGTRFGAGARDSKVLAKLDGMPLVRRVVETALASRASPTILVTGHAASGVADAVGGLPIQIVWNPHYADGMAASLRTGIAALPAGASGALVLLADMPFVGSATLDALIARCERERGSLDAVVPLFAGKTGHPVLIGRKLFADIMRLDGDRGAKSLMSEPGRVVLSCAVDDPGIHVDVDTREVYAGLGGSA